MASSTARSCFSNSSRRVVFFEAADDVLADAEVADVDFPLSCFLTSTRKQMVRIILISSMFKSTTGKLCVPFLPDETLRSAECFSLPRRAFALLPPRDELLELDE